MDRPENLDVAAPGWRHGRARVNGVHLHYVTAGTGPLVVLLHGFPELWYSWRHQIQPLADAGWRVVAVDLRGYNLSDRPRGVMAYRVERLLADVRGLIAHLGEPSATVVGHDWGGALAWQLAMTDPDVVSRLVILNAPHPACFRRELWRWRQLRRSWYMFFFQMPWLPERMLAARNLAFLDRMLNEEPARPDAFTAEDLRVYREALARPGVLTAAVNYYRAAVWRSLLRPPLPCRPVDVPTLVLWGERDRHLGPWLLDGLEAWATRLSIRRLPRASHWVQTDAREEVNEALVAWLAATPPRAGGGP